MKHRAIRALVAGLFSIASLSAHVHAMDVLLLRSGDQVTGRIVDESDSSVTINVFHSRYDGASYGVETYPARDVVRRMSRITPRAELAVRRASAEPQGAPALLEVATWAKKARLGAAEVQDLVVAALLAAPGDEEIMKSARKLLGSRGAKALGRDRRLSTERRALEAELLAAPDHEARKEIHAQLKKEHDADEPLYYYERAWRSHRQPRGYESNRTLTFRSAEIKGVYALFVPEDYDPYRSYPLLIGLHGGGPGGKDGTEVVGDGEAAMQKYRPQGEARGYIIACPDAIDAGWGGANSHFIDAIIAELELLYSIDQNRIFLAGHSMGGGGTWAQGPRLSEKLAAIGPLSAFNSGGFNALVNHHTAVYCYHGENDNICPVSAGRNAAKGLKKLMGDWPVQEFIYTEVPDSGHGYPHEVAVEMFDFFADKVRWVGKGKKAAPTSGRLSSFLARPGREEALYFGKFEDMDDAATSGAGKRAGALFEQLLLGGGSGAEAAVELGALAADDRKVLGKLGEVAADPRRNPAFVPDVRKLAARALGLSGRPESAVALHDALTDDALEVRSEAARALGKLGVPASSPELLRALERQHERLAGKLQSGNHLDYADLEVALGAFAALCEGARGVAGARGPGSAELAAALEGSVIDLGVMGDVIVDYSARVGEDPVRLRRRFAREHLLHTYDVLDDAAGAPGLRSLLELFDAGDPARKLIEEVLARW